MSIGPAPANGIDAAEAAMPIVRKLPRDIELAIGRRALELALRAHQKAVRAMRHQVLCGRLVPSAIEGWWPPFPRLTLREQSALARELGISLVTLQAAIGRAGRALTESCRGRAINGSESQCDDWRAPASPSTEAHDQGSEQNGQ